MARPHIPAGQHGPGSPGPGQPWPPQPPTHPDWPGPARPWAPEPPRPAPRPETLPSARWWPVPSESLDERLRAQRLVVLSGHLDTDTATRAAAELMTLDATGDEPINVQLACGDGDLDAAEMLADTVDLAGVEVRVRCLGVVGGPPLLVLAAASHRTIAPHATVQLTEPRMDTTGTATELSRAAEAHKAAVERMHRRLAEASGRDLDAVAEDCRNSRRLTAEEAVGYGLVHEIDREARPK